MAPLSCRELSRQSSASEVPQAFKFCKFSSSAALYSFLQKRFEQSVRAASFALHGL